MAVQNVKDLEVYNKAYQLAMEIAITKEQHTQLTSLNHEVGRMLGSMLKQPEKFIQRKKV